MDDGGHVTRHETWDDVMADVEQWHRDHPWLSRWYGLQRLYKDARRHLRRPKWAWQRARRGYSDRDHWSFDTFVCGVIAQACDDFRDHGIGYPGGMTVEEWHTLLDGIAGPLRRYADDKFEDLDDEAAIYADAVAAMHRFADRLGSMWD